MRPYSEDGLKLKLYMVEHNLSNKEMAELLGVTHQTVYNYLKGDRKVPLWVKKLIKYENKYESRN